MKDFMLREGNVYYGSDVIYKDNDALTINTLVEDSCIYILILLSSGRCVVLALNEDGNEIWNTDELGISIYDTDNSYKMDIEENNVVIFSFTYVFVLSKSTGHLIEHDYNR